VSRYPNAEALTSWAGLAPKHRESDTKVIRGPITKAGSKLVRWAAIEAVSGRRGGTKLRADFDAIAERRGKYKARAAVAANSSRSCSMACATARSAASQPNGQRELGNPAGCGSRNGMTPLISSAGRVSA
jgi:hypothetical protein